METVLEHLKGRHLDLNLHSPMIDEVERVATFFLYNLTGQIVGYHQYRPGAPKAAKNHPRDSRYFTFRKQPTLALWGMESFYLTPHVLFLTEGAFDAARLTERGYSALATLSNDPSPDLKNWLRMLNRKVVAVCDSDTSGSKLKKFGNFCEIVQGAKDLGEASDEYVNYLLRKYK